MKVTIERKAGMAAFGQAASVVEGKTTIPILSNVMLVADRDRLSISATDLDMECSVEIDARVAAKGTITASASTMAEIFRKLPEGADAELSFDPKTDQRLLFRSGRSTFHLPSLPAGDFPIMGAEGLTWGGEIGAELLLVLLSKVAPSISTEETRYYLNGCYVHTLLDEGRTVLRLVSTDGHRLNMAQIDLPSGFEAGGGGVIIPRKAVKVMMRLLAGTKAPARLRMGPQKVQLEVGGTVLTSKVIDGAFPDYTRVIPRENTKILTVDVKLLADATERVALVSTEKSKSCKIGVQPGALTLTVRNMEAGQGSDVVETDYDGQAFDIGFNARYMVEALAQIDAETAEFQFGDQASPALLIDSKNPDNRFVLMPLRV